MTQANARVGGSGRVFVAVAYRQKVGRGTVNEGIAGGLKTRERERSRVQVPPRVILSRKGFDSGSGGGASPILPDGRMLSLPIPDLRTQSRYSDLMIDGRSYLDLMHELGYSRYRRSHSAHLDPDLIKDARPRQGGWRPLFGQVAQSAAHLAGNGVGSGDLFFFWGLFRHTVRTAQGLRFTGQPFHAFYGYMEADKVLDAGKGEAVGWAPEFPHFADKYAGTNCTVYVARRQLSADESLPGHGVFRFSDLLRLTREGSKGLTGWSLPECFHPSQGASLSYHGSAERWQQPADGRVQMQAVARGQEFVATGNEAIGRWAVGLIRDADRWA